METLNETGQQIDKCFAIVPIGDGRLEACSQRVYLKLHLRVRTVLDERKQSAGVFRREHPGITVEVEIAASDEILRRLVSGRVQLALVGAMEADERVELSPFLEDEIVGVAKPGSAPLKNGALAPAKLADFMLLTREPGSSSQRAIDQELQGIGIPPVGRWELGSSEAIKRAAREGLGLAFLSRYAVAEEVERGDLESFRLAGRPPLLRHFSIAHLAGRPLAPAEQSFVTTLTSCCAKQADYAAACVGRPHMRKRVTA